VEPGSGGIGSFERVSHRPYTRSGLGWLILALLLSGPALAVSFSEPDSSPFALIAAALLGLPPLVLSLRDYRKSVTILVDSKAEQALVVRRSISGERADRCPFGQVREVVMEREFLYPEPMFGWRILIVLMQGADIVLEEPTFDRAAHAAFKIGGILGVPASYLERGGRRTITLPPEAMYPPLQRSFGVKVLQVVLILGIFLALYFRLRQF